MASSPITSWQIEGDKVEAGTDFVSLGSRITADSDCSHEIKRYLLLGRKIMANLDSMLKSKDIILLTKVCIVKAIVFPVVLYGCEKWTIKVWCFQIVVLETVTWTSTREGHLDFKDIKLITPKRNQLWISIGRTNAKAEAPILWLSNAKRRLH